MVVKLTKGDNLSYALPNSAWKTSLASISMFEVCEAAAHLVQVQGDLRHVPAEARVGQHARKELLLSEVPLVLQKSFPAREVS